jgi:choline dehydrogenase-like flavoprotein
VERVAGWDARRRREFQTLLRIIDNRLAAVVFTRSVRRFTTLEPAERHARLATLEQSRLPTARTMLQALRRTILSTYYALPESWEGIGYRGPYHRRAPAVEWEGPLRGVYDDAGPVAVEPGAVAAQAETLHVAPPPVRGDVIRTEICVVGSGAGGAVAAARLAEAGRDVVVLEAGRHWSSDAFDEEEAVQMPRLYAEQANRSTDDLAIPIFQGACVGGGSTVNWMIMLRPPDFVLEEWRDDHGVEGMSPGEMRPELERIEREVHAHVVPAAAHSPNNRIILDGARVLGWDARAARINARHCIRTGHCGLGCRYDAKQSALVTFLPRAVRAGAERLERRRDGWRVHTAGGAAVEARVVMLAAGAVGTPILLQRSALGGRAVGRYLRLHPTTAVAGVFGREIYAASGIPQSACCDHFLTEHGGYGFWMEAPPLQPALAAIAHQGFGPAHRAMMERFPRLGVLIVLVRDGADRARSSGRVWEGRHGRTHIRYRLGAADRRTMREGLEATLRMMLAAGASEAHTLHVGAAPVRRAADIAAPLARPAGPNQLGVFSAHVNGTCRMGTDPARSVCTPDAEVRGAPGVYVCDGSLMPTAPGVNPQETIMAMASVISGRV